MNFLENMSRKEGYLGFLANGISEGNLSMEFLEKTNQEIMIELERQFLDFSGSQSTSLSSDRMEQVVKSWFYALDLYVDTFLKEDILEELNGSTMKKFYNDAYSYIQIYIEEAKLLYKEIESMRIRLDNVVYEDTFTRAIPEFFVNYNFKYDAESLVSDIDYPLIFDRMDKKGIRYIRSYLEKFKMENDACRYFDSLHLNAVLNDYSLKNKVSLKDLPTNHFEPVIQAHFFKAAVSDISDKLVLSLAEYDQLLGIFDNMNPNHIERKLQKLHKSYSSKILYWDGPVRQYVNHFITEKRPFWQGAIESRNLSNLITIKK